MLVVYGQEKYSYRIIYSSQCDVKRDGAVLEEITNIPLFLDDTVLFYSNSHLRVQRYHEGRQDSLLIFVGRYGAKRFEQICKKSYINKESWFKKRCEDIKSAFFMPSGIGEPSNTSVYKNESEKKSYSSIPLKIKSLLENDEIDSFSDFIDADMVEYDYDRGKIIVTNTSTQVFYFDIIAVSGGNCYSAISSDMYYVNEDYIEPGASVTYSIPSNFKDKDLFVVCSEYPVPYNCVLLSEVDVLGNDIDVKMMIKRVID